MNKIKKVLIFTLIAGFAFNTLNTNAQAQGAVSADVTVTATVIEPITIAKVTDMTFGSMSVNAAAGTMSLAPDNTVTTSGGVNAIGTAAVGGKVTIGGDGTIAYSLTIRETTMLRHSLDDDANAITGANVMPLSQFRITNNSTTVVEPTSEAAASGIGVSFIGATATFGNLSLSSNASEIFIGATISLTDAQTKGSYSGIIAVDVSYD